MRNGHVPPARHYPSRKRLRVTSPQNLSPPQPTRAGKTAPCADLRRTAPRKAGLLKNVFRTAGRGMPDPAATAPREIAPREIAPREIVPPTTGPAVLPREKMIAVPARIVRQPDEAKGVPLIAVLPIVLRAAAPGRIVRHFDPVRAVRPAPIRRTVHRVAPPEADLREDPPAARPKADLRRVPHPAVPFANARSAKDVSRGRLRGCKLSPDVANQ